ncbi:MAG: transposase [Acidobacteria bacterium]|nr:transposase [Acidobacteriota bacterium]
MILGAWNDLFDQARPAFAEQRTFERARTLAISALACLGRHTLSGVLCSAGLQFRDWSAAYRLFERERIDLQQLWRIPTRAVLEALSPAEPVVALIDDTLLRKRGHHIAGTSWRRDPLGPQFADNFIWASRFLQISLALPQQPGLAVGPARAVPVDLLHSPSPRKPSRRADTAKWDAWRAASAASAISGRGAKRIVALRDHLDELPSGKQRTLLVCADGGFTNRTVLKDLPPRTTLIGRIRRDARLYALPTPEQENHGRGRHRCYGDLLPTPEEFRRDETILWQSVQAFASGQVYDFDVKLISPVRWKHAGGDRRLALLIIRPVAYRLRKHAPLNYRKPAYLICTDPQLSPQQILQAYIWRWEVEVNFRDEKTLLGLGQPQVRTDPAVRTTAAFFVFLYALLLLALHVRHLAHTPLPSPHWNRRTPRSSRPRLTTPQAISLLRADLWASALGLPNKSGFVAPNPSATKPLLIQNTLQSAVLYATG